MDFYLNIDGRRELGASEWSVCKEEYAKEE